MNTLSFTSLFARLIAPRLSAFTPRNTRKDNSSNLDKICFSNTSRYCASVKTFHKGVGAYFTNSHLTSLSSSSRVRNASSFSLSIAPLPKRTRGALSTRILFLNHMRDAKISRRRRRRRCVFTDPLFERGDDDDDKDDDRKNDSERVRTRARLKVVFSVVASFSFSFSSSSFFSEEDLEEDICRRF